MIRDPSHESKDCMGYIFRKKRQLVSAAVSGESALSVAFTCRFAKIKACSKD
jgi:predicted transglutaminase-like cysteine proteinase